MLSFCVFLVAVFVLFFFLLTHKNIMKLNETLSSVGVDIEWTRVSEKQ